MSKRHKRPRPTTEAQRAAARANGAKSNGPVTDEGKAKAAMNALRHGLSAVSTVVLNNEDREKFAALLDSYSDEYQPATQTERDLVQYMTASKWLLERCWTLEAATLDFSREKMRAEVDSQMKTDEAVRSALAFMRSTDESTALAQLNRYAARHSREWHKAVDKLRTIQAERSAVAAEEQELQNEPDDRVENKPSQITPTAQNPEGDRRDSAVSQNEPENILTPEPAIVCRPSHHPEASDQQAPEKPEELRPAA
jgi:hypothetical protein